MPPACRTQRQVGGLVEQRADGARPVAEVAAEPSERPDDAVGAGADVDQHPAGTVVGMTLESPVTVTM